MVMMVVGVEVETRREGCRDDRHPGRCRRGPILVADQLGP